MIIIIFCRSVRPDKTYPVHSCSAAIASASSPHTECRNPSHAGVGTFSGAYGNGTATRFQNSGVCGICWRVVTCTSVFSQAMTSCAGAISSPSHVCGSVRESSRATASRASRTSPTFLRFGAHGTSSPSSFSYSADSSTA